MVKRKVMQYTPHTKKRCEVFVSLLNFHARTKPALSVTSKVKDEELYGNLFKGGQMAREALCEKIRVRVCGGICFLILCDRSMHQISPANYSEDLASSLLGPASRLSRYSQIILSKNGLGEYSLSTR